MAKKAKKLQFLVEIAQPEGASVADVKAYVEDAVSTWCGSLCPPGGYDECDPGDPLWGIGRTVKVKRFSGTPRQKSKELAIEAGLAHLDRVLGTDEP